MKRRFLSMLLCLVMLVGILPTGTMANESENVSTGEIKAEEIIDAKKEENENTVDKLNVKDASVDTNKKAVLLSADANADAACAEVTIGEDRTEYATLYEAIDAVKDCTESDGATIKLLSDVKLDQRFGYESSSAVIIDGGTFTLDLNNFTISHTKWSNSIILVADGNVTVKNGKLDLSSNVDRCAIWMRGGTAHLVSLEAQSDSIAYIVEMYNPSTVTVENCDFTAENDAIFINGGNLTIKSGTFTGNRSGVIAYHYSGSSPATVNVYDGAFNTANAGGGGSYNYGLCADPTYGTIKLYGGTFNSISTCNSNLPVAELFADGYALFDSDTNELFDASVAQINKELKIGEHKSHDFGTDAKCACGYTCHHDNVTTDDESGKVSCSVCKQDMDVEIKLNGKTTYDSDINHAIANASNYSRLTVISEERLLNIRENLYIPKNLTFYLDINGRSLSQRPLKIADGKLIAEDSKGGGQIGFEVYDGGALDFYSESVTTTISTLDVYGGSVKLYGGNINRTSYPIFKNGVKLTDFLPEGYVYYSYYGFGSLGIPLKASEVEDGSVLQRYSLAVQTCTHEGDSMSSNGTCEYCGTTVTVKLTHGENTSYYQSLEKALKNAADGDTVTLLADTTTAAEITKSITIDLGGHTLDGTNSSYTDAALTISAKNVTIKNGTVKDNAFAVKVEETGSLNVGGDVTLEAQTSIEARSGAKVSLSIGTVAIGSLSDNNKNIYGMIPKNAVLQKLDEEGNPTTDYYTYNDLKTSMTIFDSFKVVEHTSHTYESGRCKYCGQICTHPSFSSAGVCEACGQQAVFLVCEYGENDGEWFVTLKDAVDYVNTCDLEMPCITTSVWEYTSNESVTLTKFLIYRNINRIRKLSFADGKSFIVENGGSLSVLSNISNVTVKKGGSVGVNETVTVDELTVEEGTKTKLPGGTFGKITLSGNVKLKDILFSTAEVAYTFRYNNDKSWAADEDLEKTEIENVTVARKPFINEKITADSFEQIYHGENVFKLTAEVTPSYYMSEDDKAKIEYKWFAVNGEYEIPYGNKATLIETISGTGNYKYKCKITYDGYTREVPVELIVKHATPSVKAPTAKTDLVYNGSEQELVNKGTVNEGIDDGNACKLQYRLGEDGSWQDEIPKAQNAGKYTVYYKVVGDDTNYIIGSDVYSVPVEIKKADIVIKSFDIDRKVYDGTKTAVVKTVEFETDNGLVLGTDFTAAAEFDDENAGDNKAVTVTVTLKDTEKTKNYSLKSNTLKMDGCKIEQAGSSVSDPTAKTDLVYNGKEQELVNAGTASGGTLKYKLDGGDWQTEIPKAKNAGDYKVYYKVDGGTNYTGTTESSFNVTIDKATAVIKDFILQDKVYDGTKTAVVKTVEFETDNGLVLGTDFTAAAEYKDENAGDNKKATVTVALLNTGAANNYQLASSEKEKTGVSIARRDISAEVIQSAAFKEMTYNGKPQTPELTADITIDGGRLKVTGTWNVVTNVTDPAVFVADGNFIGSIERESGMKKKSIADSDVSVALGDALTYNGKEQTQNVTARFGDIDVTFDVSGNTAKNVKKDGDYTLTVEGSGNFEGTRTLDWNIAAAKPKENADKKTTASVRRGRTLEDASVTNGELLGVDDTVLAGTFEWVDGTKVMNANGTEQMKFSPDDENYCDVTLDVEVSTYSTGGGGSGSSSASSIPLYTVKFDTDGGSSISDVKVSYNSALTEPTAPKKDGFKFGGWFTDKELKNKYNFAAKVTKSFTLYAAWTEKETEPDPNPTDNPTNPDTTNQFNDVGKDDWYYDDVISAVEKGLFKGTNDRTFDPNESITRGMFVTVLYRTEGEPAVNKSIPFTDVSADSYYANAVIWAEQSKVVKGISETEFAPNDKITREQIAAMMFRYAKYKGYDVTQGGMQIREFGDFEKISDYAADAMTWAVNTGLIKGKTATTINPQDNATRAEIAAILNRFLEANK